MFLKKTLEKNPKLIEAAIRLHQTGQILPDTYVIDLDTVLNNARVIKEEADKYGIKLYYMPKQLGRNPYLCKKVEELGYAGVVAVDFKEARVLAKAGVKIGHLGHLVQIPNSMIREALEMKPEVITVYSIEKAQAIDEASKEMGIVQGIMIKVYREGDRLYPGQYSGFDIDDLEDVIEKLKLLKNISISGITHFPCFLYNKDSNEIEETHNLTTLLKAKEIIENLGIDLKQINTPSSNCSISLAKVAHFGGTHAEPGHGISGTTPYHMANDTLEIPAMVYVSEVSHNFEGKAYYYGGGHYRRSLMKKSLVGRNFDSLKLIDSNMPESEAIDYYFELDKGAIVGDSVIQNFRTQIFVTRSDVAIVEGISTDNIRLIGIWNSLGDRIS